MRWRQVNLVALDTATVYSTSITASAYCICIQYIGCAAAWVNASRSGANAAEGAAVETVASYNTDGWNWDNWHY